MNKEDNIHLPITFLKHKETQAFRKDEKKEKKFRV